MLPISRAPTFTGGCVASPHYLASSAGLRVLAAGGNALDAAIATNLALSVVMPYACGLGGDLFAMVWDGNAVHAYNGSGRAAADATAVNVRRQVAGGEMPVTGPLAVTVPGAVEGWFTLSERFGSRPFSELAAAAHTYAHDGFVPTHGGAAALAAGKALFDRYGAGGDVYGKAQPGVRFRQPGLAALLERLGREGPRPFYHGDIAQAACARTTALGGLLTFDDFAAHAGEWVDPVSSTYRDLLVHEMPPNSQGVTALLAFNIVERLGQTHAALRGDGGVGAPPGAREHLMIEAMKLALADRDTFLSDPRAMTMTAAELASKQWAATRAATVDSDRASFPDPGRAAAGGTIYLCTADANGMCVSLIQSNYMGFGSGVHVPEWGINLQNRGAYFSLDDHHVNVIAPRKRTLHTLMPAMAMRDGRPAFVFGTMGADGQAQTQLQILTAAVDQGQDLQAALAAPRWFVSPRDFTVTLEARFAPEVLDGLRARGQRIEVTRNYDRLMGHANAIAVGPDGFAAATDPRSEGAALGL